MTGARTLALDHSIVADNSDSSDYGPDLYQVFTGILTANYSLIGDSTGSAPVNVGGTSLIGTAAAPIDPMLGALADNGGPTMTHALLAGSPAIDAGDPSAAAGIDGIPAFDQRGDGFTRVYGDDIDMGALESQPIIMPPALPADGNGDGEANAADYVFWKKFFGTMGLAPYTGGDADGDGDVDDDDNDVWQVNFGEMTPGAGSAASAAAAMVEPAMHAEGASFEAASVNRLAVEPEQAIKLQEANTEQLASTQQEPARAELVGPSVSRRTDSRPSIRLSLGETAALTTNRRDEAILAWLEQFEPMQDASDWQESNVWEIEQVQSANDLQFDSVDEVFALLIG
jgi:hypothetical protein